jgi:hypothetical protein
MFMHKPSAPASISEQAANDLPLDPQTISNQSL